MPVTTKRPMNPSGGRERVLDVAAKAASVRSDRSSAHHLSRRHLGLPIKHVVRPECTRTRSAALPRDDRFAGGVLLKGLRPVMSSTKIVWVPSL